MFWKKKTDPVSGTGPTKPPTSLCCISLFVHRHHLLFVARMKMFRVLLSMMLSGTASAAPNYAKFPLRSTYR